MNLTLVFPDRAAQFWPFAQVFLEKGVLVSEEMLSIEYVQYSVFNGFWQLWMVNDDEGFIAALTTRIVDFNTDKKRCEVTLCGGEESKEWVPLFLKEVDKFAREWKCDCIAIMGRKGWERLCRPFGYEHSCTTIVKPLRSLN